MQSIHHCPLFVIKRNQLLEKGFPSDKTGALHGFLAGGSRYSLTVLQDNLQARPIARFENRDSHFNRRTSLIFRTANLSCGITSLPPH
jgi:hypothetical protein